MSVRLSRTDDAGAVARLVQEGIDPSYGRCTIVGCSGYARYVRAQMEGQRHAGPTSWWVSDGEGSIDGACEMRTFGETLFLNNIYVCDQSRGRGVGTALLRASLTMERSPGTHVLELDVLADNAPARAWYVSFGLSDQETSAWADAGDLHSRRRAEGEFSVAGWEVAEAVHSQYGFSELAVESPRRRWTVGRLAGNWWRLNDTESLDDPVLLGALSAIDPARRLLVRVAEGGDLPGPCSVLARTVRMRGRLREVIDSMGEGADE